MNAHRGKRVFHIFTILSLLLIGGLLSNNASAQTLIASDDFSTGTFPNTGSGWAASWSFSGSVSVVTGRLELDGVTPMAWRTVDLTAATSAYLLFDTVDDSSNNGLCVDISIDGGTSWPDQCITLTDSGGGTVTEITGNDSFSVSLSSYTGNNVTIGFRSTGDNANDEMYVDNIEIRSGVSASPDPLNIYVGTGGDITLSVDSAVAADLTLALSGNDTNIATVPATDPVITSGNTSTSFTVTSVAEGTTTVTITPDDTNYPAITVTINVNAAQCTGTRPIFPNIAPGYASFNSHAYPTYLFMASYDWLHNFTDRNASNSGSNTDPDTDNFNKIIVTDSNLFPIYSAVEGDYEFPNITARNALSWAGGGRKTPSVNDYFNRSVAVAADYIDKKNISYPIVSSACFGTTYKFTTATRGSSSNPGVIQYGARSFMEWAFIIDPGNNNLRRYEFQKKGGINAFVSGEDYVELEVSDAGKSMDGVCNAPGSEGWYVGETPYALGADLVTPATDPPTLDTDTNSCGAKPWQAIAPNIDPTWCNDATDTCDATSPSVTNGCYSYEKVIWTCKHGDKGSPNACQAQNPTTSTIADCLADWAPAAGYDFPALELPGPGSKYYECPDGGCTFPLTICGNGRESSSDTIAVGLNSGEGDARPANYNPAGYGNFAPASDFQIIAGYDTMTDNNAMRDCREITIAVTNAYDDDSKDGVQFKIYIYAMQQGAFVIDDIQMGEGDNAFAVKYTGTEAMRETRWSVITSFLETVPPKSYPGYHDYTSSVRGVVGYGFPTNTSFSSAQNVRFKDPRDVDVYRDMFDADNGGPVYIFVADSGNSRIQVFMNATGSAGVSNADFPIRPVRVKGPYAYGAYSTNELAKPLATGVYADGRKADWRGYTTVGGTSFSNSTLPPLAGRGEFYYPHGVAVDQDPDTKDVYVFVADTYNHRVQVFRDTTGVSFQPITNKRFNFVYETGWGTYPLQTTQTIVEPGPYHFRYPKGIDVARFANNSSYLYVVDSKNYRLLKYLVTEGSAVEGIKNISTVGGYGYDGNSNTFSTNLLAVAGTPLTAHTDFETDGQAALGFVNPQDVATGYSGFYIYSSPRAGNYPFQVSTTLSGATQYRGVQFLDNHMMYVTDYARNNTSITTTRLNMRVMQFVEFPQRKFVSTFLPWRTDPNITIEKSTVGESIFGPYNGSYDSTGTTTGGTVEGSTSNVPGVANVYTDRPVGIAALTWNTVEPFDMRVIDMDTHRLYPNGTTIAGNTEVRIGAMHRKFFGLPFTNVSGFTNFTAQEADSDQTVLNLDGTYVNRVHAFCYNSSGAFLNHTALHEIPFLLEPDDLDASCSYMKVIAEDRFFWTSGKTGTQIFKVQ